MAKQTQKQKQIISLKISGKYASESLLIFGSQYNYKTIIYNLKALSQHNVLKL
jgi:hypothetical protein